jgi:hypothetical protein
MQSNEPGCYNNEKEGLPLLSVAASAGKKFNSLLELYAIKKKHKRSTSSIGPNHAPCTMYLQPTFGPTFGNNGMKKCKIKTKAIKSIRKMVSTSID